MSKKGGKSGKQESSYDTRDIVLGKVRGYPPWPGMVVDPESVPSMVLKERPTTKKTHFYCVRFFPTGDFAWLVSKDISKLQQHEIQSYINEPYKKSGELLQGYRIALDPTKWEQEREAESRLAAEEEANAEVDQLDSENDGSGDLDEEIDLKSKKSKKRKRDSDISGSTATVKAKRALKKKDGVEGKKKSASAASGKPRKNGRKSNTMVESEEEDGDNEAGDDGDVGPSKKGSPPPPKKQKRDGEDEGDDVLRDPEALRVRDWRHKLQKAFLGHKGLPKEEDLPNIDALFSTVENYDKITIANLQFSKIGKVMRHIAILADERVPGNAEFRFKDRADALVKKWQQILNAASKGQTQNGSSPTTGGGGGAGGAGGGDIISAGPISAVTGLMREESDAGVVTKGTAAIDLNGKAVGEVASMAAESIVAPPSSEPTAARDVMMDTGSA